MRRLVDESPRDVSSERIMILVAPGCWQALRLKDVTYVKACGRDSWFFTLDGESYRSHLPLAKLRMFLKPYGFRRCHHSYLVNLDNIVQVVKRSARDRAIILKGEEPARIPLHRDMTGILQDFLWLK